MADEGELVHSDLDSYIQGTDWSRMGENIGTDGSVDAIFDALMASSSHKANILSPDFTHIGIGVAVVDGSIWTSHVFAG